MSPIRSARCVAFVVSIVALCLCATAALSAPVSLEDARRVAEGMLLQQTGIEHQALDDAVSLAQGDQQDEAPAYHAINLAPSGWVIVSGDDLAYPVIGFSENGSLGESSPPPAFMAWMQSVEAEIAAARAAQLAAPAATGAAWRRLQSYDYADYQADQADQATAARRSVTPLLQTTWSQGRYYNAQCPTDSGGEDGHAFVGCVAAAMGQIMKYHNHPATGTGSHSYTHSSYGSLSANFGATNYQWSQMPSRLSGHNSAVATLLYHAGVSVEMNYGPEGSGADSWSVPNALRTYFKYQADDMVSRSDYSDSAWMAKLRADLDAARPVYYRGYDPAAKGGHAFVCDGYSSSDLFHFNWGWSGDYDGYFTVDELAPGSYNWEEGQSAIFGIKPIGGGGGTEAAKVDSLYAVSGARVGGTATLGARVSNTGGVAFASDTRVYFYVQDANEKGSYVGDISVGGQSAGSAVNKSIAWSIPASLTPGNYVYWARVYSWSKKQWVSDWSAGKGFQIGTGGGGSESASVAQPWQVSGAACGGSARLGADVTNTGSGYLSSNTRVWFYVQGPSGSGYVGSALVNDIAPGRTAAKSLTWSIASNLTSGNYSYWARVWNSTTSSWVSPWSSARTFSVSSAASGYTIWGVYNTACCTSQSLAFQVTIDGRAKTSVVSSCTSTPTWEGYQTAEPGTKRYSYAISGCVNLSGSLTTSTSLAAGNKYYFQLEADQGAPLIRLYQAREGTNATQDVGAPLEVIPLDVSVADGLSACHGTAVPASLD